MLLPSAALLVAQPAKAPTTTPATRPAPPAPKTKEQREAEEIASVMDFLKQTQPDAFESARRLRETDPEKFKSLIQPTVRIVNSLENLRKNDPELYELKIKDYQFAFQAKRLAEQLHRPDLTPADREKLMANLTDLISREFDNAQQIRRKEIEGQIRRLQSVFEEREKNKEKHLQRRLNELAPPPPPPAK